MKLYHNDDLIAQYKGLLATEKNIPLISQKIEIEQEEILVEVYGYAITKVLLQIHINGNKVAGDDF